jgi:hypothetical protein
MARINIFDVDGEPHDFSARRSVIDMRYSEQRWDERNGFRISDHFGVYTVSPKELKRSEDAERAAIIEAYGRAPLDADAEPELASGATGGVELGSLPGCSKDNERKTLGNIREVSERIFGTDDDWFGTRNG